MKKIDITTQQWIDVTKELSKKLPWHQMAHVRNIFEVHKNQKMIDDMKQISEYAKSSKEK